MKKIVKFILFLTLTYSCTNKNNSTTKEINSKIDTKSNTVEKVLNEYMDAWAKHDRIKIESYYAANVIWYDLPSDYTTKGKLEVGKAITDAFLNNVQEMYWIKNGDTVKNILYRHFSYFYKLNTLKSTS